MSTTRTLSIDESALGETRRTDHVYVALSGGKPIGGARWALDDIDRVEIAALGARRSATAARCVSRFRIRGCRRRKRYNLDPERYR